MRVSAGTVHHEGTYIISFLTRHNESIKDNKTTIFTLHSRVSLVRFSFCWSRHNRLLMTSQWPDNCEAITWIGILNSLHIDYIHGNIHVRSCKYISYFVALVTWKCASKLLDRFLSSSEVTWRHSYGLLQAWKNYDNTITTMIKYKNDVAAANVIMVMMIIHNSNAFDDE